VRLQVTAQTLRETFLYCSFPLFFTDKPLDFFKACLYSSKGSIAVPPLEPQAPRVKIYVQSSGAHIFGSDGVSVAILCFL
jgi:hypothetical protein